MKITSETVEKAIKPFLQAERGHTDDSLIAERGKTDDSLSDLRKKAERETDATVKSDRNEADRKRAERPSSLQENKTVKAERAHADEALRNERVQKERVLSQFLHNEREETDVNLSHERKQTDAAVQSSSKLLNDEMGLHSKTKDELTTRDELLAIVSHDLKNPIGSILSCSDMLLTDPEFEQISPSLKNWIQLIKRNAESSLHLISDILDMERIAEGKLQLELVQQSLSKVVREAIDPFAHLASTNRILLRAVPPEKEVVTSFDHDRLSQVLSNLIGNALKFTPEGGSVVLCVEQDNKESVVSVRDSGVGIPESQRKLIFDRYAQIGKKDRRGIGLGLYISRMLIESHGGRIWVTSAPDKGSVFHFSIPN